MLEKMVNSHQYFDFSVKLALLAAKRDFLKYDVWLKDSCKRFGNQFIEILIKYIRD